MDLPPAGALNPTTTQLVPSATTRSLSTARATGAFGTFGVNAKALVV